MVSRVGSDFGVDWLYVLSVAHLLGGSDESDADETGTEEIV